MGSLLGPTALGHALMTLISFLILIFCVHRFAWTPLMNVLDQRKRLITKELNEGHDLKAASEKANKEAQAKLTQSRVEANKIVNDAKKQGEELKIRLKQEANQDIDAMKAQAQRRIERERQEVLAEMEDTIASVSVEIAEKIIKHEINEDDHRRLINDFIHRLEEEVKHG
ncbi:F0F1 ATP synthase subunit B [Eremococcus coleocola]|uniref:F0F1 ATP synthase subunit B n=1 Tax=Eremococcus coleocola TaxID=88132 RepID=UPI00041A11A1|nr:F0F1 ATP synthase subunit B [Eremococcus coleocola]